MPEVEQSLIKQGSEVVLHFDLKLADGSAADSTRVNNKPAKLVIGDGSLTLNFEDCLLGLQTGDKKSFTLEANDAFGMPNPDNLHHLERSKFLILPGPYHKSLYHHRLSRTFLARIQMLSRTRTACPTRHRPRRSD